MYQSRLSIWPMMCSSLNVYFYTAVAPLWPPDTPSCVVARPPFGNSYCIFREKVFEIVGFSGSGYSGLGLRNKGLELRI